MAHSPLFKVEKINNSAWGVYKRDCGSEGGWVLLKAHRNEEDAENYLSTLLGLYKWKFGKQKVDETYSFEDCVDDWIVTNGAWKV